jgi:hypothetical protein
VCVYYCSTYYKAVREGGGGWSGGHVLRETTSRGRCELVCPSRTSERGGEGYCVKEGGGDGCTAPASETRHRGKRAAASQPVCSGVAAHDRTCAATSRRSRARALRRCGAAVRPHWRTVFFPFRISNVMRSVWSSHLLLSSDISRPSSDKVSDRYSSM